MGSVLSRNLIDAISSVFPFFWTSTYQKSRFSRHPFVPAPPTVTLHITDACPLKCSFCFASDAQKITPIKEEELRELMKTFEETQRIIIVGGEPFCYNGLEQIIRPARKVKGEIEIFTNGASLISSGEGAASFIERYLPERDLLTLTISIDSFHRQQLGEKNFKKIVKAALEIQESAKASIKFNITDPEFYSNTYLNYKEIKRLLDSYDPILKMLFDRCFKERRVDEMFYFNPVVRHGTARSGEALRAIDIIRYPEIVVGRRRGDGRIAMMKHLAALWMDPVPEYLVAGYPLEDDVEYIVLNNVIRPLFGSVGDSVSALFASLLSRKNVVFDEELKKTMCNIFGETITRRFIEAAENNNICKADKLLNIVKPWMVFTGGQKTMIKIEEKETEALNDIARTGQQFTLTLTSRPDAPGLGDNTIQLFLQKEKREHPLIYQNAIKKVILEVVNNYKQGKAPYQDGTIMYMGRIIDENEDEVPIEKATFTNSSYEVVESVQQYPICINVFVSKEEGILFEYDFIKYKKASGERLVNGAARVIDALLRYLGEDVSLCEELFRENGCQELGPPLKKLRDERNGMLSKDDAVKSFNKIFFDHRTGTHNWDNEELVELILTEDLCVYSKKSVKILKDEALKRKALFTNS